MKAGYSYQNISLDNIKGEEWREIPGLEGYFLVSNFGRVRRLEYTMQYRNGALYVKPEKIIKPHIVKQANHFINDVSPFLVIKMTLHGKRHNFSIARLVYDVFVEQLKGKKKELIVLTSDCDNFNIHPSNLMAVEKSHRQKRIFQRDRFESPFLNFSDDFKKKQREAIIKKVGIKISQYSIKGRRLNSFPNMAEAARQTGVHVVSIASAAKGKTLTGGGFAWAFGNSSRFEILPLMKARKEAHRNKYGQKVSQYDFSGNKIAQFPSLQHAEEVTGISTQQIGMVLKGAYKSAKGFYWKKGYGKTKIDLSEHTWGKKSMALTQSRKVKQFSLNGKYIQTFQSVKDAARHAQVHLSSISGALNGRQKSSGGFLWEFVK